MKNPLKLFLIGSLVTLGLNACTQPAIEATTLEPGTNSSARVAVETFPSFIDLDKSVYKYSTLKVPANYAAATRRVWLQNGVYSVETDVNGMLSIFKGTTKIKTVVATNGMSSAADKIKDTDKLLLQDNMTKALLLSSYWEGNGPMPYIPLPGAKGVTRSKIYMQFWDWKFSSNGLQTDIQVSQNMNMYGQFGSANVGGYSLQVFGNSPPQAQKLQLTPDGKLQIISITGTVLWQVN